MSTFLSFIRKEFYHIFRDMRTMLIIVGIPVMQILIIGFAVSTEIKNVQVAVYDPSNDVSTRRIIDRLQASEYFEVVRMLKNPGETEEVFREGKINFVMVFSENFHENLYHTGEAAVQLIADATDPNQGSVTTTYAASILRDYQQELMQEYADSFSDSSRSADVV